MLKGKKAKGSQAQVNRSENDHYLPTGLFILFSILFLVSPYSRGLFFDEDFYMISFFIQGLFLLTIALQISRTKEFLGANKGLLLLLFAIPFVYMLAYWSSASPFLAANQTLTWFTYAILFVMLSVLIISHTPLKSALWVLCWVTLAWIVGLVFLVDLGLLSYRDAIVWERFASVFQYPNTYASIISAFLLAGLMGLTKKIPLHYQLIYGFAAIPFMLSFLYTDSRGGMLVFALGWVIGLFFLAWKEQLFYVLYTLCVAGSSLFLFSSYRNLVTEGNSILAGLLLLISSMVFTMLVILLHRFLYPKYALTSVNRLQYVLPVGFMAAGIAGVLVLGSRLKETLLSFFPEALAERLANFNLAQHSVQERFLFYKDSLAVWQDHFFLGAGGGAWRVLFENYKSLPYFSTQAHSFYMQTLVEVGIIGAAILFAFLFWIVGRGLWTYFRLSREEKSNQHIFPLALVTVLVLYLHNSIDFNMSYGTINLFLFVLLALIWDYVSLKGLDEEKGKERGDGRAGSKLFNLSIKQKNIFVYTGLTLLVFTSLFSIYKSYAYGQAETIVRSAGQGESFDQALAQVDRGLSFRPTYTRLMEVKISILGFGHQEMGNPEYIEEIKQQYTKIIDTEATVHRHYLNYAQFLWETGEQEQALEIAKQALEYGPWVTEVYESNLYYQLHYLLEEDVSADNKADKKEDLRNVLQQLEQKLTIQQGEVPKGLQLTNPIVVSDNLRLLMEQAYEYLEQS